MNNQKLTGWADSCYAGRSLGICGHLNSTGVVGHIPTGGIADLSCLSDHAQFHRRAVTGGAELCL